MVRLLCLATIPLASCIASEPYGWACYTITSSMYWPQCASKTGASLRECLCDDPLFVSISTECLTRAVANDTDPYNAFDRGFQSLCQREPEKLDLPYTVSDRRLLAGINTARAHFRNTNASQIFGAALMSYWALICLLRIGFVCMSSLAPGIVRRIRRNILSRGIKSKLFYSHVLENKRESEKKEPQKRTGSRNIGVKALPRWTAVVIVIFVALNFIFLFGDILVVEESILFKTKSMQFEKGLGYRSACLTVFLLPVLMLFGGRNNIFMPATRWSLGIFTYFHKWIARIMFTNISIHAICYSVLRTQQGLYPGVFRKFYWKWGAGAIGSLALLVILSFPYIRRRKYETFLVCHIALSVGFMVSAWYHVRTLSYGRHHMIAAMVLWGCDRVFRLFRMVLLSPGKAKVMHNDHLTCLLIENPGQWAAQPGSYIFVHFPELSFWQSHPFSIVPMPDGGIKLCVQHKKGLTKRLSTLKESQVKVWIDGPYGHHVNYKGHQSIVFIVGGVGVTLALGIIYGLLSRKEPYNIYLHWSMPYSDYLEYFVADLQRLTPDVVIYLYVTRESESDSTSLYKELPIEHGHMEIPSIVSRYTSADSSTAITVCGPPKMNDAVRKEACCALDNGHVVTFTEDLFSF